MEFVVSIEKDESGYYFASIPALPGCFSQGETIKEAKENLREALELWLESMNVRAKNSSKKTFKIAV